MKTGRPAVGRVTAVLSIVVVLLVAALALVASEASFLTRTTTSTTMQTVDEGMTTIITELTPPSGATYCVDTGPPGGLFLRVLSDSTMTPFVGANVTATNKPLFCGNGYPLDNNVTIIFTTGTTEWYSLYGQGPDASFSVAVQDAGQNYTFTAVLHPEAATCATLYLPSGRTNVTSAGSFNLSCS